MHFGFALDLSDKNLWNIDFLDRNLDLLDILFVSMTSSAEHLFVFKMSSRRLEHVLEDETLFRWRCVEDVFKTNKFLLGSTFPFDLYQLEEDFIVAQISDKDCQMLFMFIIILNFETFHFSEKV